jgi:hypothetical protein
MQSVGDRMRMNYPTVFDAGQNGGKSQLMGGEFDDNFDKVKALVRDVADIATTVQEIGEHSSDDGSRCTEIILERSPETAEIMDKSQVLKNMRKAIIDVDRDGNLQSLRAFYKDEETTQIAWEKKFDQLTEIKEEVLNRDIVLSFQALDGWVGGAFSISKIFETKEKTFNPPNSIDYRQSELKTPTKAVCEKAEFENGIYTSYERTVKQFVNKDSHFMRP